MFRNAIEKINKFYDLDLREKSGTNKLFDILNEIIRFDTGAIFYITPESLELHYEKNFDSKNTIPIDKIFSTKFYDQNNKNLSTDIKDFFNIEDNLLACQLIIKGTVLGIILITREIENFSTEEEMIFKTCTKIIANIIKDLEISQILKLQIEAMEKGIVETQKAYATIKKQNKKIKENEKLQNQFIANISHDLRTPLNSIIGFSEILAQNLFGELNNKQKEYIEDIRISGIRLLGMINEVLDISKLESHTIKLNISDINISTIIEEVCNILRPIYEKKNITIIKNIDKDINIKGDYVKLQQVIFNIVGNAIKFSPKDSQIKISAQKDTSNIIISIKDEGLGIEKKYHKKIFNKFFQIENTMSKTEVSTGLGLAIAKEFIKLHKGSINVISEKNKGSEFIIKL